MTLCVFFFSFFIVSVSHCLSRQINEDCNFTHETLVSLEMKNASLGSHPITEAGGGRGGEPLELNGPICAAALRFLNRKIIPDLFTWPCPSGYVILAGSLFLLSSLICVEQLWSDVRCRSGWPCQRGRVRMSGWTQTVFTLLLHSCIIYSQLLLHAQGTSKRRECYDDSPFFSHHI